MNKISFYGNLKKFGLNKEDIQNVVDTTLQSFDVKNSLTEISILDKDEIRAINKEYRNINKPTDVLSFPQIEIPGQNKRLLGALVISPEIVLEKDEEFNDVIKHGLLHLLGYDHETNELEWEDAAAKTNCKM